MLPLLITRPEPSAGQSLCRAFDLGLKAHSLPLFAAHAADWAVPDPESYDALLITSAQTIWLGGAGVLKLVSLPVYAVGAASAAAARAAGFHVKQVGDSDGKTLLVQMQAKGVRRILWLNGRDHTQLDGGKIQLHTLPCYAVDRVVPPTAWDALIAQPAVIMAHSTRAAEYIAELTISGRRHLILLAISAKVAAAAGTGWGAVHVAEQPHDAAMLAVAVKLCHKQPQ